MTVGLCAATWLLLHGCSVDRDITRPTQKRDLTGDEIRDKLRSLDFKEKLEAEGQIDRLEPPEKRRTLLALADDPDAAVRLIAVKHLRKADTEEARARLSRLAKDDPDPTVRELAGSP